MNGIEQIIETINKDTDAKIAEIRKEAEKRLKAVEEANEREVQKLREDSAVSNAKKSEARTERLESLANLEARQIVLKAKEKAMDEAYAIALDRLKALPSEELEKLGGTPETLIRLARERTLTKAAEILFGGPEEKK